MGCFGETIIPAALKIPGDQTIFRVDRIVLSMRAGSLVSRLFQRKLLLTKRIGADSLAFRDCRDGLALNSGGKVYHRIGCVLPL